MTKISSKFFTPPLTEENRRSLFELLGLGSFRYNFVVVHEKRIVSIVFNEFGCTPHEVRDIADAFVAAVAR